MNFRLLTYNIFDLPHDILSIIYLYLDIESIENLESLDKNYGFLSQLHFWEEYFKLNNLKMTITQQNYTEWITEFKVCDILNKFKNTENYICEYICLKDKNTIKRCNNNSVDKFIHCHEHMTINYSRRIDRSGKYITILCKDFDINYIKESNYNFKYISHYMNYDSPEIILNINHITLYVEAVKCSINYYDEIIVYNFLSKLFNDKKIKTVNCKNCYSQC